MSNARIGVSFSADFLSILVTHKYCSVGNMAMENQEQATFALLNITKIVRWFAIKYDYIVNVM